MEAYAAILESERNRTIVFAGNVDSCEWIRMLRALRPLFVRLGQWHAA